MRGMSLLLLSNEHSFPCIAEIVSTVRIEILLTHSYFNSLSNNRKPGIKLLFHQKLYFMFVSEAMFSNCRFLQLSVFNMLLVFNTAIRNSMNGLTYVIDIINPETETVLYSAVHLLYILRRTEDWSHTLSTQDSSCFAGYMVQKGSYTIGDSSSECSIFSDFPFLEMLSLHHMNHRHFFRRKVVNFRLQLVLTRNSSRSVYQCVQNGSLLRWMMETLCIEI